MAGWLKPDITLDASVAKARLLAAGKAFDQGKLLYLIGSGLLSWIMRNFEQGGIEHPWAPLAASTIAGRRKGSSSILQDTGRLKQSFVVDARATSGFVDVGTRDPRAGWHHFGTAPYEIRPRGRSPLTFLTAGGERMFRRHVHHPGLTPRRIWPSRQVALDIAQRSVETYVNEALRSSRGT